MSESATLGLPNRAEGPTVRSSPGRALKAVVIWLIFALIALSTLYPLFYLTSTALRTDADYHADPIGLPTSLTFENISNAFVHDHMARFALNSFIVVGAAVILLMVVSCLAAYALTQFEFPLRGLVFLVVVAMMALPPTILMIPIFKLVVDLGLLNQRVGLVLVYASLNLPFSIYLLAAFMKSIPRDLLNAAKVDGARTLRTLWSIVLPLVRPGLMTLVTLNFLVLWNELLFSLLILPNGDARTIMVGIAQTRGQFESGVGDLAAGLLLSMLPPFLVFAFFQRDLARGLTAGAVK